jgi:predicted transcriptional regulator
MAKRTIPKSIVIPVNPDLVERIDALARADKRSRKNWVVLQLERLVAQGPQELPAERAA